MTAPEDKRAPWTTQEAEQLLLSLRGVVSARLVTRPGGDVDEIHLLTSDEVTPKQTVRNVESALLAHLGLAVDHRKISVAQTSSPKDAPVVEATRPSAPTVRLVPKPVPQGRLLFQGYHVETERSHQVSHRVEIEWKGERFMGSASAADLPRARLEAVAKATLVSVEAAVVKELEENGGKKVTLSLDGVKVVDAFDRQFALVAVHAMAGRDVTALAGSTVVEGSADRAAILATLQATDRWVRGHL